MTWKERIWGSLTIIVIIVAMLGTMTVLAGCGNERAQKGAFLAGCPCFLCF